MSEELKNSFDQTFSDKTFMVFSNFYSKIILSSIQEPLLFSNANVNLIFRS